MRMLGVALVLVCASAAAAFSQTVDLIFPAEEAVISVDDLISPGFQWEPVDGATEYRFSILSNDLLQPQPFEPIEGITDTFLALDPANANALRPDRYFWQIEVTAGEAIGAISAFQPFELLPPGEDLIPTPTPSTPQPIPGDFDGSLRIDGQDLLMYASNWQQSSDPAISRYDINSDGRIDAHDLLLLIRGYGSNQSPLEPELLVGPVEQVTYAPANPVQVSQLRFLELTWDPPAFPQGDTFTYDVLVDSQTGFRAHFPGLTEPVVRPFPSGFAQIGPYQVYIRAEDSQGNQGPIVVSSFEIILNQGGVLPTPTPAFNDSLPAPQWERVEIDPELLNDPLLGPSPCMGEVSPQEFDLSGNDVPTFLFPTYSQNCQISGIRATRFFYSNLESAVGYELLMQRADGSDVLQFSFPVYEPYRFIRFTPDTYLLNVRALFANNQSGPWSETLTVTIPSSGE